MGPDIIVLVIEDELMLLYLLGRTLRSPQYEIVEARSGTEALSLMRQHGGRVRLAISDYYLSDMLGTQFSSEALKLQPALKILYLTGAFLPELGDQVIGKPFEIKELRARVRRELNLPEDPPED